ncbi:MAG: hypothetical protein SFT93_00345 [Rickettsiaceae bacterium]|nr:hypothetical protein [Rickettsiaceae bacterium]
MSKLKQSTSGLNMDARHNLLNLIERRPVLEAKFASIPEESLNILEQLAEDIVISSHFLSGAIPIKEYDEASQHKLRARIHAEHASNMLELGYLESNDFICGSSEDFEQRLKTAKTTHYQITGKTRGSQVFTDMVRECAKLSHLSDLVLNETMKSLNPDYKDRIGQIINTINDTKTTVDAQSLKVALERIKLDHVKIALIYGRIRPEIIFNSGSIAEQTAFKKFLDRCNSSELIRQAVELVPNSYDIFSRMDEETYKRFTKRTEDKQTHKLIMNNGLESAVFHNDADWNYLLQRNGLEVLKATKLEDQSQTVHDDHFEESHKSKSISSTKYLLLPFVTISTIIFLSCASRIYEFFIKCSSQIYEFCSSFFTESYAQKTTLDTTTEAFSDDSTIAANETETELSGLVRDNQSDIGLSFPDTN